MVVTQHIKFSSLAAAQEFNQALKMRRKERFKEWLDLFGLLKLWHWGLGRSAPVAKWRLVTQLLGLPHLAWRSHKTLSGFKKAH